MVLSFFTPPVRCTWYTLFLQQYLLQLDTVRCAVGATQNRGNTLPEAPHLPFAAHSSTCFLLRGGSVVPFTSTQLSRIFCTPENLTSHRKGSQKRFSKLLTLPIRTHGPPPRKCRRLKNEPLDHPAPGHLSFAMICTLFGLNTVGSIPCFLLGKCT